MGKAALRISLAYVLLATGWIGMSDQVVDWLAPDARTVLWMQHWKGLGFVFCTAFLLVLTIDRWEARLRQACERNVEVLSEAQQAELLLRQMAESIGEVFWLTDLTKRQMLYISPAYESIWGRSRQELLEDPRSWLAAIHPEDRERVLEAALEKQALGLYDEEYRILRPDGEVRWIRDRAFPVLDTHAQVYRVAGVATDITIRKRAEDASEDASARLHIALADSGMCVWEWSMEDGTLLWTEEASLLLGPNPPADLDAFVEQVHPVDRGIILETARLAGEQRHDFMCEFRLLLEGGGLLWVETRGRPRSDGRTYLGTLRDITRARLAAADHERQAARMEAIVESSRDAIITADEQLTILDFNPGAQRIFGYTPDQALGRSLLELVPEGLRADLRMRLQSHNPTGPATEHRAGVPRGLRSGGEEFPQESTIARLRLPEERLYTLTVRDNTEQERADERRRMLEEQLRQAQKMEAVGQLAGGVAHDFNNLLTVVQGNTNLLLSAGHLDDSTAAALADVARAAERAAELTQQLLVFSGKQIMQPRQMDLLAVLEELSQRLICNLGSSIELQLELSPTAPIRADRGLIEQIVMSLSLNARDAMPQGGRLRLGLREVVRSQEPHSGSWVELSVSDTGIGIAPELREHIFEPFFTTKEVGQGTGLGLAMVYAAVEQHGGFLELDSECGRGSCFRIYLPPEAREAARPVLPAPRPTSPHGHEVVLVVEDDPAVRHLMGRILVQSGREVLTAESGADALRVWGEHKDRVDLLLTDMIMPGSMTGRQLALRLLEDKRDLKILYTSGYSREELRSVAPEELEGSFLPKPYLPHQLVAAVSECLG